MKLIFRQYLALLSNRDFLVLMIVIFIGQLATAFLLLSLIVSVFLETKSNFGVSGIVLSVSVPGLLLMAVAGLVADIFDRRKVIILANFSITLVVLLILISKAQAVASIPLSFLYFVGNTFFLPAAQAATGQVVKKRDLFIANSLFIFVFSVGILLGLFAAAVIHFFFGSRPTLLICEIFLIAALVISAFLPPLIPRKKKGHAIVATLNDIFKTFVYIASRKSVWFSFGIFVLMQSWVAFGVTLAPGFFDEIIGIGIDKSPIFMFPLIGLGVVVGSFLVHSPKTSEGVYSALGIGIMGVVTLTLGLAIKSGQFNGGWLLSAVSVFLVFLGLGEIMAIVASRTGLQRKVPHNYQGTIFGASIIASSFFSSTLSPMAAFFEAIFGYVSILIFAGVFLVILSLAVILVGSRWKL